jgi:hypothetical protein
VGEVKGSISYDYNYIRELSDGLLSLACNLFVSIHMKQSYGHNAKSEETILGSTESDSLVFGNGFVSSVCTRLC